MSSTNKNGRKFLIWTAVLAAFSVGIEEYRKNRQNSIDEIRSHFFNYWRDH